MLGTGSYANECEREVIYPRLNPTHTLTHNLEADTQNCIFKNATQHNIKILITSTYLICCRLKEKRHNGDTPKIL